MPKDSAEFWADFLLLAVDLFTSMMGVISKSNDTSFSIEPEAVFLMGMMYSFARGFFLTEPIFFVTTKLEGKFKLVVHSNSFLSIGTNFSFESLYVKSFVFGLGSGKVTW